ncbi:Fe(3+)-hydroxamate ABC transporter permease FhuB [Antarcticirhabdus aurantiaca]|uniref:Fe(3+)-hydroxamate ABC transporter permease FhuB n=1 Tax=Antarcticirhabdus aurantiaca TaxID=2606717 RepID=A0ACD4NPK0_9HYPH|nr:Fe(3+)-hydroxamate ABC transporter permease FhuB [Antarcticirhabdus aurantiaca]WAJ28748.1 Fe(3+)-hydroxamate ABC transporter permease FhuB [Jeongeuplla avenae]
MSALRQPSGPGALALGLLAATLAAGVLVLLPAVRELAGAPPPAAAFDPGRMVLLYSTLPRLVMALLCGAMLGLAGALLQAALGNPLASPTTIGTDAGARLALALAGLFAPALYGWGRDLVALGGAGAATGLVFLLSHRQGFAAVSLVLAGLVVSLYAGALAGLLTLVEDRYLAGLLIWGAGSLSQQSWDPAIGLATRAALLLPLVFLLVRPLQLVELGEDAARGLGVPAARLRLFAIALAVALAAFVSAAVGVIGFVGLVAPTIARAAGAARVKHRLVWSAVLGGLILLLTDLLVTLLAGPFADFLPTGAVTAVLGSPILLWLLPRVSRREAPPLKPADPERARRRPGRGALAFALLALAAFAAALLLGHGPGGGFGVATGAALDAVLPFRWPRLVGSAGAGALLGLAGLLLQRLTANPMASPEVVGVSAGATFAMVLSVFLIGVAGAASVTAAALLGSLAALLLVLAVARRSGFAPERVLLAGLAVNALLDAVVVVLSATGDPRAIQLLGWLAGFTANVSPGSAVLVAVGAGLLVPLALLLQRWLALLPLGFPPAAALGVPVPAARATLLAMSGLAVALATPVIGPLSFVGLMAPNIVRRLGIQAAGAAILASAACGALVLLVADIAANALAYPLQLPTGLVASLVGAPFLLWLLQSRKAA